MQSSSIIEHCRKVEIEKEKANIMTIIEKYVNLSSVTKPCFTLRKMVKF